MNLPRILLRSLISAAAALAAAQTHAGSLFYVAVPATNSDAGSGITTDNVYTSAVAGGRSPDGGLVVGGVQFSPLVLSGNAAAGNNVTLNAATGALAAGGGKSANIAADGALGQALSRMTFNDGAENGSEQYVVLDPASLQAGKTYDLRIYVCNPSSQNRQVNLSFAGDGQAAVETEYFNEDDATTSPGAFADPNQVYYIDYRFIWDGATTPGVTVTQKAGSTPFSFYLLTNQEVPGGRSATPPAGAIAAAPAPHPSQYLHSSETAPAAIQTDVGEDTDTSQQPDVGVSSDTFYNADSLQKNGRWVDVGTYGRCWQPTQVGQDWTPYSVGQWQYAPAGGWTWASNEEWGWATYHYGRWCRSEVGWCWAPGRVWAPSWCSWRFGGGHVGWAPLPPEAGFSVSVGIGGWADSHYGLGPYAYNFCATGDFGSPDISRVIVNRERNTTLIQNTTNVTNITNYNHNVYSGGPSFTSINNGIVRAGGHPLTPVVIDRRPTAGPLGPGGKAALLKGNVLTVAAPKIATGKPTSLPKVAATIPAEKVDKGWGQVKDPKLANQLKGKIAQESHGLTPQTAPARVSPGLIGKAEAAAGKAGAPGTPVLQPGHEFHKPGEVVTAKPGQPGTKPAVGIQRTGQPIVPGQGSKPGEPGRKPAEGFVKPGQPAAGPSEAIAKPNPQAHVPGEAFKKPGQPVTGTGDSIGKPIPAPRVPGEALEKARQPVVEPGGNLAKPNPAQRIPGEAVKKPAQPAAEPSERAVTPRPPARAPGEAFEKPNRPSEAVEKPAEPERKLAEPVEKPIRPPAAPMPTEAIGREHRVPQTEPPTKRPQAEPLKPAEKRPEQGVARPQAPAKPRPPVEPPKPKEPVAAPKRPEARPEVKHAPAIPPPAVGPRKPAPGPAAVEKVKGKGKPTPPPN